MALVKNNAAILIADESAEDTLVISAIDLLNDKQRSKTLADNIGLMALPQADEVIAMQVLDLAAERGKQWS